LCCAQRSTRLFHLLSCTKQVIKAGFTLGKQERLKSRKLLEQLFRDGSTLFIYPMKTYYSAKNLPAGITLQAGFGVSSRVFKKAVDRNRIKRLMREAYRLQKNNLQHSLTISGKQLAIFFLYTGKELPDFNLIKEKMSLLLQNLEKIAK
jgi:ribonuclease P protein component